MNSERVGAQLLLPRGDGLVTVGALLRRVLRALAHEPVRRGDQLLLPARQRVLILVAAAPAAAAACCCACLYCISKGLTSMK